MEWMYTNIHAVDDEGHNVVLFVAYFTQGLRLVTVRRFDACWRLLEEHTGTALGLLRAAPDRHDLDFRHGQGRDRWSAHGEAHASHLEATGEAFHISLDLAPERAPYLAGDLGVLPFADRGWFYYYSVTRMRTTGTLTLGDRVLRLQGRAWLDHQWGRFYVTPFRNPRRFEEYEWFSLQLSNGSDVILTTVWTPDGQLRNHDAFGGAGLLRADGSTGRLIGNHRLTRTGFHRDPKTGGIYSAGWRFLAPEWDCDLTITPRHPNQMTPLAATAPTGSSWAPLNRLAPFADLLGAFWEGTCSVQGRLEGERVEGDAFAELIKRHRAPRIVLEAPELRSESGTRAAVLRWRVPDRDPAVDLVFQVRITDARGRLLVRADDLEVSAFCYRTTERLVGACEVVVRASSRDGVLRSEARQSFAWGAT